ncbi:SDR family oxidoreductase [Streptomyces ipomoeae]|uniref:NmrA family protein n=1 Tax=Streptomyces ipomoeae 91-03 TaxID=698759 RepID=L1L2N7_9ACTN|nr:NAD(P)H-binding protein [Streptomyces ipomoeae]EKX66868.1 NmrA family protein [Streptomyces ipomoeae 91-03]MDX2693192.1 NAD(P)H-binding protein [Streptomyces ipomoeae]MDX2838696.1 NAD(P)H-binding protein [Streptomyces ipomoeae]
MAEEILVTGARGAVGRAALEALVERGARVRALVRGPGAAELPDGVASVVAGDLTRPDGLVPALEGVSAMLLMVVAGEDVAAVTAEARKRGVRRVVLISSGAVRDHVDRQRDLLAERHARAERAVTVSGLEWVVLRPRWLARNALWWSAALRTGRPVRLAYPEAVTAPVHERDVAEVAAVELLADHGGSACRVLTGPRILTQADQLRIIAEGTGAPARWERIPPRTWRRELQDHVPVEVLDALLHQQSTLTADQIQLSTETQRTLGRPALPFQDWVRHHRHAFLPDSRP